jgi:putative inorganic carbon (HCO3(-)) transporter
MTYSTTHRVSSTLRHDPGILGVLVVLYVVTLPYLFEVSSHLNFAPADCFLLLVIVFAFPQLKRCRSTWSYWHLGIWLTFAVGSFVTALRLGGIEPYELLNKDAGLLLPFFSYAAVTSTIGDWKDIRRILRFFMLGVVFENVIAICGFLAAYFLGMATPFTRYEGLRLSGMLVDPNAYGSLLVVAFVVCEGGSWGRAPLFKARVLWFSRLTLALGILLTFSRSAWLGLGLSFLIFFFSRPLVALRPVLAVLTAAPCVLLVLGSRFLPIFEKMASRPKQVQERLDLIDDAIQAFTRHPLLGGGLGSFRLAVGEIAHNSAMWFLADFGIVGFAVLVGFLSWFFRKAWLFYRIAPESEKPIALALLLAHAAMVGVAMGIEAFYQRHWWLILALIASGYSLAARAANIRQYQPGLLDNDDA